MGSGEVLVASAVIAGAVLVTSAFVAGLHPRVFHRHAPRVLLALAVLVVLPLAPTIAAMATLSRDDAVVVDSRTLGGLDGFTGVEVVDGAVSFESLDEGLIKTSTVPLGVVEVVHTTGQPRAEMREACASGRWVLEVHCREFVVLHLDAAASAAIASARGAPVERYIHPTSI